MSSRSRPTGSTATSSTTASRTTANSNSNSNTRSRASTRSAANKPTGSTGTRTSTAAASNNNSGNSGKPTNTAGATRNSSKPTTTSSVSASANVKADTKPTAKPTTSPTTKPTAGSGGGSTKPSGSTRSNNTNTNTNARTSTSATASANSNSNNKPTTTTNNNNNNTNGTASDKPQKGVSAASTSSSSPRERAQQHSRSSSRGSHDSSRSPSSNRDDRDTERRVVDGNGSIPDSYSPPPPGELANGYSFDDSVALAHERADELFDVVAAGDVEELVELCKAGADLTVIGGPNDETVLHIACAAGDLDLVNAVLDFEPRLVNVGRGADGATPLMLACSNSLIRPEVVESLLECGASVNAVADEYEGGPTALFAACKQMVAASRSASLASMTTLNNKADGRNSPHADVQSALEVIEALLSAADISPDTLNAADAKGTAPLHMLGASSPDPHLIKLAVSGGADVNAQDGAGRTALMAACARGFQSNVVALLAAGADASLAADNSMTALSVAVNHTPVLLSLVAQDGSLASSLGTLSIPLQAKATIEVVGLAVSGSGADLAAHASADEVVAKTAGMPTTLLHIAAAWNRDPSAATALMNLGADPTARDWSGATAFSVACSRGLLEVASAVVPPRLARSDVEVVVSQGLVGLLDDLLSAGSVPLDGVARVAMDTGVADAKHLGALAAVLVKHASTARRGSGSGSSPPSRSPSGPVSRSSSGTHQPLSTSNGNINAANSHLSKSGGSITSGSGDGPVTKYTDSVFVQGSDEAVWGEETAMTVWSRPTDMTAPAAWHRLSELYDDEDGEDRNTTTPNSNSINNTNSNNNSRSSVYNNDDDTPKATPRLGVEIVACVGLRSRSCNSDSLVSLTAALGSAADPGRLADVFLDSSPESGVYAVRLRSRSGANWGIVLIDDYVPVEQVREPHTGSRNTSSSSSSPAFVPLYASSDAGPDCVCVTVLEKAVAKSLGSYAALHNASALEVVERVLGGDISDLALPPEKDVTVGRRILSSLKEGELVLAQPKLLPKGQGSARGLAADAWYAVVAGHIVRGVGSLGGSGSVTASASSKSPPTLLLHVIGGFLDGASWEGDFAAESPLWTPAVARAVGRDPALSGFFATFDEFSEEFGSLIFVPTPPRSGKKMEVALSLAAAVSSSRLASNNNNNNVDGGNSNSNNSPNKKGSSRKGGGANGPTSLAPRKKKRGSGGAGAGGSNNVAEPDMHLSAAERYARSTAKPKFADAGIPIRSDALFLEAVNLLDSPAYSIVVSEPTVLSVDVVQLVGESPLTEEGLVTLCRWPRSEVVDGNGRPAERRVASSKSRNATSNHSSAYSTSPTRGSGSAHKKSSLASGVGSVSGEPAGRPAPAPIDLSSLPIERYIASDLTTATVVARCKASNEYRWSLTATIDGDLLGTELFIVPVVRTNYRRAAEIRARVEISARLHGDVASPTPENTASVGGGGGVSGVSGSPGSRKRGPTAASAATNKSPTSPNAPDTRAERSGQQPESARSDAQSEVESEAGGGGGESVSGESARGNKRRSSGTSPVKRSSSRVSASGGVGGGVVQATRTSTKKKGTKPKPSKSGGDSGDDESVGEVASARRRRSSSGESARLGDDNDHGEAPQPALTLDSTATGELGELLCRAKAALAIEPAGFAPRPPPNYTATAAPVTGDFYQLSPKAWRARLRAAFEIDSLKPSGGDLDAVIAVLTERDAFRDAVWAGLYTRGSGSSGASGTSGGKDSERVSSELESLAGPVLDQAARAAQQEEWEVERQKVLLANATLQRTVKKAQIETAAMRQTLASELAKAREEADAAVAAAVRTQEARHRADLVTIKKLKDEVGSLKALVMATSMNGGRALSAESTPNRSLPPVNSPDSSSVGHRELSALTRTLDKERQKVERAETARLNAEKRFAAESTEHAATREKLRETRERALNLQKQLNARDKVIAEFKRKLRSQESYRGGGGGGGGADAETKRRQEEWLESQLAALANGGDVSPLPSGGFEFGVSVGGGGVGVSVGGESSSSPGGKGGRGSAKKKKGTSSTKSSNNNNNNNNNNNSANNSSTTNRSNKSDSGDAATNNNTNVKSSSKSKSKSGSKKGSKTSSSRSALDKHADTLATEVTDSLADELDALVDSGSDSRASSANKDKDKKKKKKKKKRASEADMAAVDTSAAAGYDELGGYYDEYGGYYDVEGNYFDANGEFIAGGQTPPVPREGEGGGGGGEPVAAAAESGGGGGGGGGGGDGLGETYYDENGYAFYYDDAGSAYYYDDAGAVVYFEPNV